MKDTWIGENTELPAHLLVLQLEDGFRHICRFFLDKKIIGTGLVYCIMGLLGKESHIINISFFFFFWDREQL